MEPMDKGLGFVLWLYTIKYLNVKPELAAAGLSAMLPLGPTSSQSAY